MIISTQKNNILINNKIVFTRKYADTSFFNKPKKKKEKKDKKKLIKDISNPPICWCLNELNGISCNQCFDDINDYKYHQKECYLCKDNLERFKKEKEEEEKAKKEKECEIDEETFCIIESYERMTGKNLFMAILLGQINFNLIDKIKKEYYYDLEQEYLMEEDITYEIEDFY
tara:strand:- start:1717 stop:2232 length:516 start_codon:yes stop_codon:yes gene_type:complete